MEQTIFEALSLSKSLCKICGGKGYVIKDHNEGVEIVDCECVTEISKQILFREAHIPENLIKWEYNTLTEDFLNNNKKAVSIINTYMDNLEENIKNGIGIWFHAPPGVAKSAIACTIIKRALLLGYPAYVERASHILSYKFSEMRREPEAAELIHKLINCRVLCIEEIEKCYMGSPEKINNATPLYNSLASNMFYEFISDAYDARIALLITSNSLREDTEKLFPSYIRDRLKSLINIPLRGASGRPDRRNSPVNRGKPT